MADWVIKEIPLFLDMAMSFLRSIGFLRRKISMVSLRM
jgi:hypothetical protein